MLKQNSSRELYKLKSRSRLGGKARRNLSLYQTETVKWRHEYKQHPTKLERMWQDGSPGARANRRHGILEETMAEHRGRHSVSPRRNHQTKPTPTNQTKPTKPTNQPNQPTNQTNSPPLRRRRGLPAVRRSRPSPATAATPPEK